MDLFVLHPRAREVSVKEAAVWSAVWVAIGLGFCGLLWAWRGGGPAQAYLAGYLIEKILSLDNIFVFAVIFSAFAIPSRYQHRVLILGVLGALIMRAASILAGAALLDSGMRALYSLLAGAAGQFRYLQPGLAAILAGIAAKTLTADL